MFKCEKCGNESVNYQKHKIIIKTPIGKSQKLLCPKCFMIVDMVIRKEFNQKKGGKPNA